MPTGVQIETWKRQFRNRGPEGVKEDLAASRYGPSEGAQVTFAKQFLEEIEAQEASHHKAAELDIAREANKFAQEANKIARNANRWSMVAAGIALVALIVAALAYARP